MNADAVLDAIGNPVRRQMLSYLREGSLSVNEMAQRFDVSRPAISKHLKILQQAELVRSEPRGVSNIYHLELNGFHIAKAWLADFWDEALANFAQLAEATTNHD